MTPGYCDLRNQAETTAGKPIESVFETCMIYTQEHWKPAYSNDVNVNGNATVFIPSALIFSNGQVGDLGQLYEIGYRFQSIQFHPYQIWEGLEISIECSSGFTGLDILSNMAPF